MAVNRTRNKAITLRMTAEELALFQSQFEKSEAKNQTDFVYTKNGTGHYEPSAESSGT